MCFNFDSGRRKFENLAVNIYFKYIKPMRKLISIWMTCTLLFISSIPTVAVAAMCGATNVDSTHIEEMAEMQSTEHQETSMSTNHHDMMDKDWQTCRIECGCGCHQHLDSLPHVLSPYVISQLLDFSRMQGAEVAEYYIWSQYSYVPAVQLPPPDLS